MEVDVVLVLVVDVEVVVVVLVDVVVVVNAAVVVVVVVVVPQTNNELDNKYITPPLSPTGPREPVGNSVFDALGNIPAANDAVTAKLDVTDLLANAPAFNG